MQIFHVKKNKNKKKWTNRKITGSRNPFSIRKKKRKKVRAGTKVPKSNLRRKYPRVRNIFSRLALERRRRRRVFFLQKWTIALPDRGFSFHFSLNANCLDWNKSFQRAIPRGSFHTAKRIISIRYITPKKKNITAAARRESNVKKRHGLGLILHLSFRLYFQERERESPRFERFFIVP